MIELFRHADMPAWKVAVDVTSILFSGFMLGRWTKGAR